MDDIKVHTKTDLKVGSLFSIPFCKSSVQNFALKKQKLITLFEPFDEKKNDEDLANFSSNRYNTELVNKEFTNILRDELQSIVNAFETDFYVSDVWSNLHTKKMVITLYTIMVQLVCLVFCI